MSAVASFNRQKFLDAIITHLRAQEWKRAYYLRPVNSTDGALVASGCRYLDRSTGRRCAIGGLLPNEILEREFLFKGSSMKPNETGTMVKVADVLCGVAFLPTFVFDYLEKEYGPRRDLDFNFIRGCQSAHDEAEHGMEDRFREFAAQWQLTFLEAPPMFIANADPGDESEYAPGI